MMNIKRLSTYFLSAAIFMMGLVVLILCIFGLPHIWMNAPREVPDFYQAVRGVLVAMYIAAIPYFFALYQGLRLLGYIKHNKAFSLKSVTALKRIAVSAVIIGLVFTVSLPFFYTCADHMDAPGILPIGMFLVLGPWTIAVFAAVLQRLFREAIEIKSENDLTV